MKILVVAPDTNVGGITTSAVNFCNELSKRGNDVYFLDMSNEVRCKDSFSESVHIIPGTLEI